MIARTHLVGARTVWGLVASLCLCIPWHASGEDTTYTCGDVKRGYKNAGCCGDPLKGVDVSAILGLSEPEKFLNAINSALMAAGPEGADALAGKIMNIVDPTQDMIGKMYMELGIKWDKGYDKGPEAFYYDNGTTSNWHKDVEAVRKFRNTTEGAKAYSYRSKVKMGMAQTNVLNHPPSVTDPYDVTFDLPSVDLPGTDEGITMLSVLEMQSLLRRGLLTSRRLTEICLAMLEKYDPEFNMLEVDITDMALRYADRADEEFSNGRIHSFIQGIPFAIKDTFDIAGAVTMYGSFEYADNVVESESPLVTHALRAFAVPLLKTSVPQLTWGHANHNGVVYSCLNGGFSSGAKDSGGSSIGSGNAVCLGVVPVAICEQTGSSCQAPAIANGISTIIPALGTFSRANTGIYSMDTDRPGLLCRDIMSCAVFYNYMRGNGTDPDDPQMRGVPFADPAAEDISAYTVGFADNSNARAWPHAWDTPFFGQRSNVPTALRDAGCSVEERPLPTDFLGPQPPLLDAYQESGLGHEWFAWWDWYWTNVGFFEDTWEYGNGKGVTYGPVWVGQNYNFEQGHQKHHIGASAYAYLDDLWIHGYVADTAMYPMLQGMPDVVVHFSNSELGSTHGNSGMIRRAGINTVHIPEFYWNTTDLSFVGWTGSKPDDYYSHATLSAAMITCESKKYEPVKAFAVCHYLQKTLVPGGKLIAPLKDAVHDALKTGAHDLHCPLDWSAKMEDYMKNYPDAIKAKVMSKMHLSTEQKQPNCRFAR